MEWIGEIISGVVGAGVGTVGALITARRSEKRGDFKAVLDALKDENERIRADYQSTKDEMKDIVKRLEELENEHATVEAEKAELSHDNVQLRIANQKLVKILEEMLSEYRKLGKQVEGTSDQLLDLVKAVLQEHKE